MENLDNLDVPELCTMEMKEIDGGIEDVLFWVGMALSLVPGGVLAGQLVAGASYGISQGGGTSPNNFAKYY
ncbi:hypothetical protein [Thermophagus xiamenensis]|jgi:hypothetical protein|uniref:Uncharacterized protein n=1 Tax=Thermophagus xiamenensis TaxID=385682 RepID=A0A1I2FXM0_9BACT|nr:hypothetical protein [Thermophagus xiamenensis]SFF09547.1 hypothetical protein SAMN05444380_1385 [Thermophagus xiamenensis]